MIVTGSNLVNVVSIQFNGLAAPVYGAREDGIAGRNQVLQEPPGSDYDVTPDGTATSTTEFDVGGLGPPVVSWFTPVLGPVGTEITFQGSNLVHVTGISFNGTDATFSTFVGSDRVRSDQCDHRPHHRHDSAGFVHDCAELCGHECRRAGHYRVSPLDGYPGTVVALTGTNFTLTAHVWFGDVPATPSLSWR